MKAPLCCLALAVIFLAACRLMSAEPFTPSIVGRSPTLGYMTGNATSKTLVTASPTRPAAIASPAVSPVSQGNPRWVIYEKALSKAVINKDDGLCEWEILGTSGTEIYVWVLCMARDWPGTAGSGPAVIHLAEDGGIKGVDIPGDGYSYPKDIRAMFPLDLQAKVLKQDVGNCCISEDHIKARMMTNDPPMFVILGTPLPSSISDTLTPTAPPPLTVQPAIQ